MSSFISGQPTAFLLAIAFVMFAGVMVFTLFIIKKQKKKEAQIKTLDGIIKYKKRQSRNLLLFMLGLVAVIVLILIFSPNGQSFSVVVSNLSSPYSIVFAILIIFTLFYVRTGQKWSKKISEDGKSGSLPSIEERIKLDSPCKVNVTIVSEFKAMGYYRVFLNNDKAGELKKGQSLTVETEYKENQIVILFNNDTIQREFNFLAESGGEKSITFDLINFILDE